MPRTRPRPRASSDRSLVSTAPSAATSVAAVIGNPVTHSLSPSIHNAAFEHLGLDWTFVAFDVAEHELDSAVEGLRSLKIGGVSVTTPHKAAIVPLLDEVTGAAARLDAVNCVVRSGERLVGHNTDGDGLVLSLAHEPGVDVAGRRVAVLGAGGAARSIIDAVARAGAAEVLVVNRSADRAEVAAALAGTLGRVAGPDDLESCSLIVNATSVGMGPAGGLPADPARFGPDHVVVDLVYEPLETEFLRALRARGVVAIDGLGMLVGQAAKAFELWTGHPAPLEVMRTAVRRRL